MDKTDIFFDILQNLDELDLIIKIDEQLKRLDIRRVTIYSVSEEDNEIIVSQTKPPIGRNMIGQEIEASFVANPQDKPERFFLLTRIKGIRLFSLTKSRLVEAISLHPVQKEIYKRSLRLSPRLGCSEGYPLHVVIAPDNEKFSVMDISEGGLCFLCPRTMFNSIRFVPHKRLNIKIELPDDRYILGEAEVVRRFEKEEVPDMYYVGIRFLDLSEWDQEKLKSVLMKLRGEKP